MIVYIYELGLMETGKLNDMDDKELQGYARVKDYKMVTIDKDMKQNETLIPAYVKKYDA